MKKRYQISIPNPCQEDWEAMHRSGKGRYCDSCEKHIQDFSKMSDHELIERLLSDQSHCGNFDVEQLDRMLRMDKHNLLPTVNLRAIAMGFGILVTATSFASSNPSENSSIDLIGCINGTADLKYVDDSDAADANCYFVVTDTRGNLVIGAKLELLDARENVTDVITTDANGIASYNRKMIQEMRVVEIRVIPKGKDHKRTVVPFQGIQRTDYQSIQLENKVDKKLQRKYRRRRKHVRGMMAW